jgi:plasmid stabilization system protein ParE
MTIKHSPRFIIELEDIIDFIAQNSIANANRFLDDLESKINDISNNPYIYRKRLNSKYQNCRELIFKGYCIPYLIDTQEDTIVILGIYKQNLWQE